MKKKLLTALLGTVLTITVMAGIASVVQAKGSCPRGCAWSIDRGCIMCPKR